MTEKKSEKNELCRGVFWVNGDDILSVKYPCTSDGDLICDDTENAEKLDQKLINHKSCGSSFRTISPQDCRSTICREVESRCARAER